MGYDKLGMNEHIEGLSGTKPTSIYTPAQRLMQLGDASEGNSFRCSPHVT